MTEAINGNGVTELVQSDVLATHVTCFIATIMVSKNYLIVGEHVVIIFVT